MESPKLISFFLLDSSEYESWEMALLVSAALQRAHWKDVWKGLTDLSKVNISSV